MKVYKGAKGFIPYLRQTKDDREVEIWAYPNEVYFSARGPSGDVAFTIKGAALKKLLKYIKDMAK